MTEGAAQSRVDGANGRGREALRSLAIEQALHGFRTEPDKAHLSELGNQVPFDIYCVAPKRARPQRRSRSFIEPFSEEGSDGRARVGEGEP